MLGGPFFKSDPAVLIFDPLSTFGIWGRFGKLPFTGIITIHWKLYTTSTLPLRCRVLVEGTKMPLSLLGFFQYGISKKIFHNQFRNILSSDLQETGTYFST